MSAEISRRTLAKGALWSAPMIVATAAVPAYAASQKLYQADPTQNKEMYKNGGKITDLYVFTTDSEDGKVPGFSVWYNACEGEDTTATLQRLDYYVMVPVGFDNDGAPRALGSTSTYWTSLTRVNDSTLTLADGSSVSTQGYHLHKMSYTGPKTHDVVERDSATA